MSVVAMPIIYVCHGCGRRLAVVSYDDKSRMFIVKFTWCKRRRYRKSLEDAVDLVRTFRWNCPYCGAWLGDSLKGKPLKIEVK